MPAALPVVTPRERKPGSINIKQVAQLKAQGLSTRQTGKIIGKSHVAVINALKKYELEVAPIEVFKENRSDIFAGLQEKLIAIQLTSDRIEKMNPQTAALWFNSFYNNERLERNLSTANLASQGNVIIQRVQDRVNRLKSSSDKLPDNSHNVLPKVQNDDITQDSSDFTSDTSCQNSRYLYQSNNDAQSVTDTVQSSKAVSKGSTSPKRSRSSKVVKGRGQGGGGGRTRKVEK